MDDLPELPFEKVLSYLNLEDRLRLSAVSRSCHEKIIRIKVKSLCFSERPIGLIYGKSRWVNGAFAKHFIRSTRFASFFDAFGQSILSNLKHLTLCDLRLDLNVRNELAFDRTLSSFADLEVLDIIRMKCSPYQVFELNLPMLIRIHLEELSEIGLLTLDAPRLRKIELVDSPRVRLDIVRHESVESLIINVAKDQTWMDFFNLKTVIMNLKNLQYLHIDSLPYTDPIPLSSLNQLKEFHTNDRNILWNLFEQKQRHSRTDLKIYFCGLLLNRPNDPATNALPWSPQKNYLCPGGFECLAANLSRLADVIPFYKELDYSGIERVTPELEVDVLRRFTELNKLIVDCPVQDIQRFLDLLKNCKNISSLEFTEAQPQDLLGQLSEPCAIQHLTIRETLSDFAFLFRLKHLIHLSIVSGRPIGVKLIRKAFEELPVLSLFEFMNDWNLLVRTEICPPKFMISISGVKEDTVSDLNAALEFIFGKRQEKRKAEEMK